MWCGVQPGPGERYGSLVDRSTNKAFEAPSVGLLTFGMRHRRRLPSEDRDTLTKE